jgi:hypothetical protein
MTAESAPRPQPLKLILHIGSHRAASTSIQDYLYSHAADLASQGVLYPADMLPEYPRQHSYLARLLAKGDYAAVRAFLDEVAASARDLDCGTVLLSGEDFCVLPARLVARFHAAVAEVFDAQAFVMLVRNKRDFLLSSYLLHLRHAGPTTEIGFGQKFRFSPRESIATWKAYFSADAQVLLYDEIREDLLRVFFRQVLGIECSARVVSNRSLDYLTASIYNIFLKDHASAELDHVLWTRRNTIDGHFAIEDVVADDLNGALPDDDWRFPEAEGHESQLLARSTRTPTVDPILVCESMLELFAMLKEHFVEEEAGQHPRVNPA